MVSALLFTWRVLSVALLAFVLTLMSLIVLSSLSSTPAVVLTSVVLVSLSLVLRSSMANPAPVSVGAITAVADYAYTIRMLTHRHFHGPPVRHPFRSAKSVAVDALQTEKAVADIKLEAAVDSITDPKLADWLAILCEKAAAEYYHKGIIMHEKDRFSIPLSEFKLQLQAATDVFDAYAARLRSHSAALEVALQASKEASQKPGALLPTGDMEMKEIVSALAAAAPLPKSQVVRPRRARAVYSRPPSPVALPVDVRADTETQLMDGEDTE